eukprot:TRINITY_DN12175_c0_g2_i1.p1 TRINITY_DN12175_c0_g2~~TRINITY_DN12175_c0_g2_i1.p1  ORF type:complete len:420 (+),score=42.00 TRINITY_DN12175_c0_g2_i1:74-1333(+)
MPHPEPAGPRPPRGRPPGQAPRGKPGVFDALVPPSAQGARRPQPQSTRRARGSPCPQRGRTPRSPRRAGGSPRSPRSPRGPRSPRKQCAAAKHPPGSPQHSATGSPRGASPRPPWQPREQRRDAGLPAPPGSPSFGGHHQRDEQRQRVASCQRALFGELLRGDLQPDRGLTACADTPLRPILERGLRVVDDSAPLWRRRQRQRAEELRLLAERARERDQLLQGLPSSPSHDSGPQGKLQDTVRTLDSTVYARTYSNNPDFNATLQEEYTDHRRRIDWVNRHTPLVIRRQMPLLLEADARINSTAWRDRQARAAKARKEFSCRRFKFPKYTQTGSRELQVNVERIRNAIEYRSNADRIWQELGLGNCHSPVSSPRGAFPGSPTSPRSGSSRRDTRDTLELVADEVGAALGLPSDGAGASP